jgi:hypothetical protein
MAGFIPPELRQQLFSNDNWTIRRRWLRIGMVALWANAEWVLWELLDSVTPNAITLQIFMMLIGAIMTIFMGFVFGAVWDDSNKRHHISQMDDDTPADPTPKNAASPAHTE